MSDLIEELQWRGLVAQHTDIDRLREDFASGSVTFYCGFDPTAPSLHHGHLVQLILMRHLQLAGHRPLALVGGATGLIGDPRPSGERTLNDPAVVAQWCDGLREQISRFLSFDGKNAAQMVNNLDWMEGMSAIGFLRDVGKYFRLGQMLAKDIVARRLNSDEGISYTEFSYQILQAYDYLQLYRRYGCTLETGGNDQWGNLVGGMDLIHKVEGKSVSVLTTPIITKADGTKFGKSEGGAIWLNPDMFSPYAFYQFWLQTADEDVVRFLKIFTFLTREEIAELEQQTAEKPQARVAQRRLAEEVTRLVHGQEQLTQVQAATEALWGSGNLREVEAKTLRSAVEHLPSGTIKLGEANTVDGILAAGLEQGRSAAMRLVKSNGLSVNNEKVADADRVFTDADLLPGDFILLRKGKRNLVALFAE